MKIKKLVIYGVGRFAEYAAFVFNNDSIYRVKGYCMEKEYLEKYPSFKKEDVISFDQIEDKFSPKDHYIFIAVGNNIIRERIYRTAIEKGYDCATYVSSKSHYWKNLVVGNNSFIGEGSVIQPFTEIGDNSILFNAHIGHHSKIGNHTLLSSCLLGGNVQIGEFSFLGLNSTVKENTIVAERNLLGMGVTIFQDTLPNSIYSSPTSKKRKLSFTEFYRNSTE